MRFGELKNQLFEHLLKGQGHRDSFLHSTNAYTYKILNHLTSRQISSALDKTVSTDNRQMTL